MYKKRRRAPYNRYTLAKRRRITYPRTVANRRRAPLATRGWKAPVNEKKVFDIDTAFYEANSTGTITLLCVPVTGTDFTARVGRKIIMKNVYIRGFVRLENAVDFQNALAVAQLCRFIMFVDYQPNGAVPAITDVLKESTAFSQLNLNNRERFKILKDKQWVFDPMPVDAEGAGFFNRTCYPFKCYKKLNIPVVFNSTNGGTIADINTGALYMMWIGNVAAGASTNSVAFLSTRVRFEDS